MIEHRKPLKAVLLLSLVLLVGLTACGSGQPNQAAPSALPATEVQKPTATQVVPTDTATVTPSVTPTEPLTATPTPYADWALQPDGSYVHEDHDNFQMELDEGSITFQVWPPSTGTLRVSEVLAVVDSALADWGMTESERDDLDSALQNAVTSGSGGLGTFDEKYLLGVGSGPQNSLVISLFHN